MTDSMSACMSAFDNPKLIYELSRAYQFSSYMYTTIFFLYIEIKIYLMDNRRVIFNKSLSLIETFPLRGHSHILSATKGGSGESRRGGGRMGETISNVF